MKKLNITKLPSKFKRSIELVAKQLGVSISDHGILLELAIQGEGITVTKKEDKATITIGKEPYFLRALGLLVEAIDEKNTSINIKETPAYDSLEIMLDCSRNGVLNFEAYKEYAINVALMGYTTIQLYMEGTYEIKGRPYFGYLRGRYTADQLKEMDAYTDSLFLELVPAIQTLAHLGTTLKWKEFEDVVDYGDIVAAIPKDISLVYWDYYGEDKGIYNRMIAKHKEMSDNIIFAGGAWKWSGFSPANLYSHKIGRLAHESCMENNIKQVIIMAWGDNRAEASVFSILPTLQLWAELCYNNNSEESHLASRFRTCTTGDYEAFFKLDMPILTPNNPAPGKQAVNPTKYILYQDILTGLLDKHIDKASYTLHFQKCSRELEEIIQNQPSKWNYIFETQKALCDILAIKTHTGINIRTAYKAGDKERLETYATVFLPELIKAIEIFIEVYRKQWMKENKFFGLDVFDIRMGGLIQRIKTAKLLITQYLSNEISYIEELEEEILAYSGKYNEPGEIDVAVPHLHTIATPSNIQSV